MAKKKKTDNTKEIVGRIITICFALLLIGGGYYLYTLFVQPLEINSENLTGTWKLSGDKDVYYVFAVNKEGEMMEGAATTYYQDKNSLERKDTVKYTYTMAPNDKDVMEMYMQPLNDRGRADGDPVLIKITGLTKAQMFVKINRSVDTALVRVDLF